MRRTLFALLNIVISAPVLAAPFQTHSDSGIEGPPYVKIVEELRNLETTFPETAKVLEYGTSVRGKTLTALRIAKPAEMSSLVRPVVVISGSTHGNEYLNIEDRLPRAFLERQETSTAIQEFLNIGGVFYMIPILNPDGYDSDVRGNARGKDLNRDFTTPPTNTLRFTQPETKSLADFLHAEFETQNLTLTAAVDYHCCIGALLYPWSYTNRPIPQEDLEEHRAIGQMMKDIMGSNYKYGTTNQILGYIAHGTSKDYYYGRYGAIAFTYEGAYRTERNKFEQHVQMWENILQVVTKKIRGY